MGNKMKNKVRKSLRALVIVFLISIAALVLNSCAEKSLVKVRPVKKAKVGEEFIVQKSSKKTPKWVDEPEFQIVKIKREKFIVVKADVSAKDRRAAERIAEGELRKRIAEGIKTLVESQFREAMSGTQEEYSENFQSYVATVSKSVPVIGFIVTDTYWEKIEKVKSKNEVEYYYRVVKRGRMPYKNYLEARDKAWKDVLEGIKNDEEKAVLEKLISAMEKGESE